MMGQQGLKSAPKLAIGDGALGFWKAVSKLWPETDQQRCWVHKTTNILEKLPKAMQSKIKTTLHRPFGRRKPGKKLTRPLTTVLNGSSRNIRKR
jgi:transposase-like protein